MRLLWLLHPVITAAQLFKLFATDTCISRPLLSYRVVIKWAVHGSYWKPSLFQNLPFRPRLPVAHSPLPTGWKWKTWKLRDFLKQLGTANVTQTGVNFICRRLVCVYKQKPAKKFSQPTWAEPCHQKPQPPPETEGGCNCRRIALTMWAGVRWHKTNPGQPLTWLYAGFCIELIVDWSF